MLGTPLGMVLLLLLTIGLVIAISLWLTTLPSSQMAELELVKLIYRGVELANDYYNISVEVYNHSTRDVCIMELLVNGRPYADVSVKVIPDPHNLVIKAGERVKISVMLDRKYYTSGTSVELDIRFSTGGSYKLYVSLP